MKNYIGIDIGGTYIKYGIVNQKGAVVFHGQASTWREEVPLTQAVPEIIQALLDRGYDCEAIGVSTAGIVDSDRGSVLYANQNLPGYAGTDWKQVLRRFGLSVHVENDVNAAALAEAWVGSGKALKSFFCMTIGTGIGGALVVEGEVFHGSHFSAGEVGYMNTEYGTFESAASVSALVRWAGVRLHDEQASGKSIFEQIRKGNGAYKKLVQEWCGRLGRGIENIMYLFDPDAVILGGGISREGGCFLNMILPSVREHMPEYYRDKMDLRSAGCGNDAGVIGSVYPFVKKR